MYNQMNDTVTADTDEFEGQTIAPTTDLGSMSNEELAAALENYIEQDATHQFLGNQLDGLSDWWSESVFEEAQQRMDDGEIPMTSMYMPFFTFHRGGNANMRARQSAFRYWEVDRDLGNTMGMPPVAAVRHRTIQDIHDQYETGFDWLLPHGATQEQVDYLTDDAIERSNDMERYDGGWAYWMPSNQRRPRDHPLFEDMVQEMIDQTEDDEEGQLTEMSDGTYTGSMSEYLTDDNFLSGYWTSDQMMDEFRDSVATAVENFEDMREEFINTLGQPQVGPAVVGEEEDNRTGEEDLIALPSARIPLEDKVRIGRDMISP